jgi:hypothetical protein
MITFEVAVLKSMAIQFLHRIGKPLARSISKMYDQETESKALAISSLRSSDGVLDWW